jgi:cell wall-associated NlpC family hydrolase
VRLEPPGWGYQPPLHRYPGRRGPELGGVAVLVVTVLATLAAPHARTVRGVVAGGLAELPAIDRPAHAPATGGARVGRAVAFALAQQGKPCRWGANGPQAFDCSGADLGGLACRRGGHPPDRGRPARRPPPGA